MKRTQRIVLSALALSGVAVLSTPGTASAAAEDYPTAYNTKTQRLDHPPNSGMDTACVSRPVVLNEGVYDWGQILGSGKRPNFELGAGEYAWEDCLYPDDGFYVHLTSLNPENPDWDTVSLSTPVFLSQSGDYRWGSYLDPKF